MSVMPSPARQPFPNENRRRPRFWLCARTVRLRTLQTCRRDLRIQLHRIEQLLLLDVFAFGMSDVNRSRPDQQRYSPVASARNVGSEFGDHGLDARNRASSIYGISRMNLRFGLTTQRLA